jgi:hypothetical protein
MAVSITFQVIDGVDKGRVYRNLDTPVTIGREEGNLLRLNDERISRFHAKVQQDQGDLILTDLDSTNGTRVNGNVVQIHRLRVGDCITLGRSVLLFGSNDEIAARLEKVNALKRPIPPAAKPPRNPAKGHLEPTVLQGPSMPSLSGKDDLTFNMNDQVQVTDSGLYIGGREFPPLPLNLGPSQAARLAEILERLHHGLAQALERARSGEDGNEVVLDFATWQNIVAVEMLLARYQRAISDPESWHVG